MTEGIDTPIFWVYTPCIY